MEASDQSMVITRLQNSGQLPLSAELSAEKSTTTRIVSFIRPNKITSKDIRILTRELATLLNAGLPLDHALLTLENLSQSAHVKRLVQDIHAQVQGGATLSHALQAQDGVFSPLYLNMVRAGENSGAMEIIFSRLADYLDRSAELRSAIVTALIYPVILFCIALLSIFALLLFVVPQFTPLFADAGKTLPLLTQIVFGSADFVRQYWWMIPLLLVLLAWYIDRQLQQPTARITWDARLLKLPVLGSLIIKLDMNRFARTLGTLLTNGVPLLTSIQIVREVITNRVIRNTMDSCTSSIEQGRGMARALSEATYIPPLVIELVQVGEETGQLEAMLFKLADIYDQDVRKTIDRLLTLLEPILIIGLGALIAMIIISILVAILGLNELVV